MPPEHTFNFTVAGASGETAECVFGEGQQQIVIEGAIRGSLEEGWTIDSCPANGGCAPLESVITVQADQLEVAIPEGAFVRATVTKAALGPPEYWTCRKRLVIENLPVWSGLSNPVPAAPGASELALWLAGHDGSPLDEPIDVFTVALEPVCEVGQFLDSIYDLRFDSPNAQGAALSVPWGETRDWIVGEGPIAGQYRARNLHARDFCCHEAKLHSYWIARPPAP